ncbi:protein of unknown function [Bradyrhizobium vignae]|uniref:Uncharacterized protein n=1 Tax=Bradyrhizobium vignae TaxID=1549949 RepID=A0A2U3PV98_9BRAD|nr:protein of unknown function [Bradyrhizobium vignae]
MNIMSARNSITLAAGANLPDPMSRLPDKPTADVVTFECMEHVILRSRR